MPGVNRDRKDSGKDSRILFGDGTGFHFSSFQFEKRGSAAAVRKRTSQSDFPLPVKLLDITSMGLQGLFKNGSTLNPVGTRLIEKQECLLHEC